MYTTKSDFSTWKQEWNSHSQACTVSTLYIYIIYKIYLYLYSFNHLDEPEMECVWDFFVLSHFYKCKFCILVSFLQLSIFLPPLLDSLWSLNSFLLLTVFGCGWCSVNLIKAKCVILFLVLAHSGEIIGRYKSGYYAYLSQTLLVASRAALCARALWVPYVPHLLEGPHFCGLTVSMYSCSEFMFVMVLIILDDIACPKHARYPSRL